MNIYTYNMKEYRNGSILSLIISVVFLWFFYNTWQLLFVGISLGMFSIYGFWKYFIYSDRPLYSCGIDEDKKDFIWVVEQGIKSLPLDEIDKIEARINLLWGGEGSDRIFSVLKNGKEIELPFVWVHHFNEIEIRARPFIKVIRKELRP